MDENGELSEESDFDDNTLFDFCMIPAETMGWLNHYATEIAYRRVVLSPRPPMKKAGCQHCNGAGCNQCNRGGYNGYCKSRCVTFYEWASQCGGAYCRDRASKPEGFFRRVVDGLDNTLEQAVYGNSGDGISGGLYGGVGTDSGSQSGYGSQGYNSGYGQSPSGAGYVPSAQNAVPAMPPVPAG